MQIAKSFDTTTLKNMGVSLLKTLVSALSVWLASNIDGIGEVFKDPTVALIATTIIRLGITTVDEWLKGEKVV